MEVEFCKNQFKLIQPASNKGGFFYCKHQTVMYYNQHTVIYHKGEFVKAIDANANVYDTSLHYGYAVFEGIRSYNTGNGVKIFKAQEHFQRMEYSAKTIGIPYPYKNDDLIDISYEVLKRNNL